MTALKNRTGVLVGVLTMLLGIGVLFASSAQAAVITVTTGEDVVASDGQCSLREAIDSANFDFDFTFGDCGAGTGADIIGFDVAVDSVAVTINTDPASQGDMNVEGDLDIDDPAGLTIDGGASGVTIIGLTNERVFERIDGPLTLVNVSITGGRASVTGGSDGNGGAIALRGGDPVFITGGTISNNIADGPDATNGGGGIYATDGGTVDLFATVVDSNAATGTSGSGGGIFVDGVDLTVDTGAVTGNTANRAGGGIEVTTGSVTLTNFTDLSDNVAGPMGSAAPGNGGGLHVTGAATVTVNGSTTVHGNHAASEGGGLWNSSSGTMRVVDGFVGTVDTPNVASGDDATNGGGGIFNDGGTLDVFDSTVTGNDADGTAGSGGGIFSVAGDVTIDNSFIGSGALGDGNFANRAGGGIEVIAGTLTVQNDSAVGGNEADGGPDGQVSTTDGAPGNGGGIHVSDAATVVIDESNIDGNRAAREGGGLWNSASGTMTVQNGSTVGNGLTSFANYASGPAADDGGGGIFNNGGTLTVTDSSLLENQAEGAAGSGGGIFSTGGLVTITGSSITGNTANRAGGGIEVIDGTVNLTGSGLNDNEAISTPGNGGGLHTGGTGFVTVTGSTVSGNSAVEGGGLWNSATGTLTINDGTQITGNTANGPAPDQGGGGIFNDGGTLNVSGGAPSLIDGNTAPGAAGSGGGIHNLGGTVTIHTATVSNNRAQRAGGGIENESGSLTIEGAFIDGNAIGMAPSPGNGGGIHNGGTGAATVIGSSVIHNTAEEGGGLWNSGSGTMTLERTTVVENTAYGSTATTGGGGIFQATGAGVLTVLGTGVTGNSAPNGSGSGGGIMSMAGTVTIDGGDVNDNVANRAGGGIEIVDGSLTITDVSVRDNAANGGADGAGAIDGPGNGGGVHVTGAATVTVDGASVAGNTAASEGGGLWNSATGTMTVDNGTTITNNTATGPGSAQGGGGIFNNGGILDITGASTLIDGNTAPGLEGSGGGIQTIGGTVTITDATISGNRAQRAGGGIENAGGTLDLFNAGVTDNGIGMAPNPGNGGGIHTGGDGTVTLTGTFVARNTALEGGGLWNSDAGSLTLNGSTIVANTASGTDAVNGGGGIFQTTGAGVLNVFDSSVTANSAPDGSASGGGIMSLGGTITIDGSLIDDNTASRAGGGIEIVDGTLDITDSTVVVNDAGTNPGNGGGIHSGGTGIVSIVDSTIDGNSAVEGGGLWNSGGGLLTIDSSTLSNNAANGAEGGGLYDDGGTGLVDVINSTISGNSAVAGAGAFDSSSDGSFTLTNVTVTDNDGGGLGGAGYMTVNNSIIGGFGQSPDCDAPIGSGDGVNLDTDGSCGVDLTGDPQLSALADNGGPTLTHLIAGRSPAAGRGQTCPAVDQRGITRPANGCALGSVEVQRISPVPPPVPITPQGPPPVDLGLNGLQPGDVITLGGDDPTATAIIISQQRFDTKNDDPGFAQVGGRLADYVLLSRDDLFADTLSASSLEADGPLLFTPSAILSDRSATEIDRVLQPGDTVYVLGGDSAVAPAVVEALTAAGYQVTRIGGATRVETSVAIATLVATRNGSVTDAVVARANGPSPTSEWADSVSGGAWAADTMSPVLLTQTETLHPVVEAWLDANQPTRTVVLGGEAAISSTVFDQLPAAERFAGSNRFSTATTIARDLWENPRVGFLIGSGSDEFGWATGLAAAGLGADLDYPLLLVEADRLPDETDMATMCTDGLRPPLILVGSNGQINQSVEDQLRVC